MNQQSVKRARGRNFAVAVAALTVVIAVAGGSVVWGATGVAFGRDAAISTAHVLGGEQARADRLPAGFPAEQHGDGGIVATSSRLLGVKSGTRYWIALDSRSNVCVLAQSTIRVDLTAASCSSPGDLETRGASLSVGGGSWKFEAFLLPDSVDASSVKGGWAAVSDNLVTFTGSGSAGPIELRRDPGLPGVPITLTLEPAPVG